MNCSTVIFEHCQCVPSRSSLFSSCPSSFKTFDDSIYSYIYAIKEKKLYGQSYLGPSWRLGKATSRVAQKLFRVDDWQMLNKNRYREITINHQKIEPVTALFNYPYIKQGLLSCCRFGTHSSTNHVCHTDKWSWLLSCVMQNKIKLMRTRCIPSADFSWTFVFYYWYTCNFSVFVNEILALNNKIYNFTLIPDS